MAWFGPDDVEGRIAHAFKVERFLVWLGYSVAVVGVLAIVWTVGGALIGNTGWTRAVVTSFGILAATVLSGAAAYASGTNVGLAAARLKRDVEKG
jgi:predicted anti-sigma-YlaC factor YlaD